MKKKHSEFLEINEMIAEVKPPEMNGIAESIQVKFHKVNWKTEPSDPPKTSASEDQEMKTLRIYGRG